MANNTTHVEGYRTAAEVCDAAAEYQLDGYTTVQIGPTAFVQAQAGSSVLWPIVADQPWFVLIATKDPMTVPAHHAPASAATP
ncbi:hypothetical protein [Sphingomonas sp. PAMC 26605]|uniref:hypothetical protein n=1 Tax=Sphingomonas sp. PAMC 26605 TaxID=1112214 RepID=UPI00026CD0AA|nr:hypothetical protein [Sphingomonas sp. PAMC 26605]